MNEKLANATKCLGKAAGDLLLKGARRAGRFAYDHRREAFGATVGMTKGAFKMVGDLYGHTRTDSDFSEKIDELRRQSDEYRELHGMLKKKSDKEMLLDSLGISFVYLDDYVLIKEFPDEVQSAYEAAFPHVAARQSLSEMVNGRSDAEVTGIMNVIKGKLFEQRYVEYLNDGNLPDGYEAVLAGSPTNPGWDIAILDSSGNVDGLLQAKATESLDYVQSALERYPDITIVTTEEVYGHLAMHGIAGNVVDSGISNEELTLLIESSIGSGQELSVNFGPPIIPALIIGYSVYRKENISRFEKGEEFGKRYVESYVSCIVGGMAMCATNFWLFGIVAALGSKYCLYRGRKKNAVYEGLTESIERNQKIIDDLKRRMAYD